MIHISCNLDIESNTIFYNNPQIQISGLVGTQSADGNLNPIQSNLPGALIRKYCYVRIESHAVVLSRHTPIQPSRGKLLTKSASESNHEWHEVRLHMV